MDIASPNRIANQRAIIDRRELLARLDELVGGADKPVDALRNDALGLVKEALEQGRATIRRRFDDNPDNAAKGVACVRELSFLVDQIIRVLFDFAYEHAYPLANPTLGERMAVVAVGGYGREELAPHSDIDLLFLLSYKITPHAEQVVEFILYMLWDLGLKVGHATRSVDDGIRMARSDQTIRTAMLEARYLWGDNKIYGELRRRFRSLSEEDSGLEFVETKLAERDERHQKLGDSRYVLEPNVKDGKGGLRDLHTLFWIAKYIYQVDDMAALVDRKVFTKRECERFRRAHAFLTTVRCQLHYLTGRAEDRLTFDVQPVIGEKLGYQDRSKARSVERFMKHYYLVAKDVGDLTRIFCAALEDENRRKSRISLSSLLSRRRELGDFVAVNGRLNVGDKKAFRDDPVNLLRLFHVAQTHKLDIHPAALRQVTQSLSLIDGAVREDPEANRLFLDMLTAHEAPAETLKRLNEAGVLGRFIPDFGRVVAQMQHDMYHVFTVDEHLIRAIDLLHRIEKGELGDDHPLATDIIHTINYRRVLYVAVFLHDIAKGRGGNHSELGAEIAERLGPRFGLDDDETETVVWLVRYHLSMSMVAQKRDIDDPKTIRDFAELIQSPERLRLLLALTIVDMRATGPAVWNGWKAALLRDLYYRTEELLAGAPGRGQIERRVKAAQAAMAERLTGWTADVLERHMALGYPSYWLSLDAETHAKHAKMIREAEAAATPIAIDVDVDAYRDITEITVYAPDHPGLFSQIAGAMALSGANVADAKIFTLTNGYALDIFIIQDVEGEPFDRPEQIAKLEQRITDSVTGRLRPWRELAGRHSLPKRARAVFQVPTRVIIDNAASGTHTLVEVNGRDRPGLLYDVTRVLTGLGLQISSAKISTFGERVVDVFYVKDVFGLKVEHDQKKREIQEVLLAALAEEPEAPAEKTAAAEVAA
jgi:[protein-PII] uridylyltransferase